MMKSLVKLALIAVLFIGIVGAASKSLLQSQPKQAKPAKAVAVLPDDLFGWKFHVVKFPSTGSTKNLIAYSDIRDPGGVASGLPVRLKVPAIGVDSAIEDALITPDGRMDVPAGSVNVAWFALGPHPGDVGSAVIGGHYGISNGVPWVFYNLDKIKVGNKIYIENDKGATLAFIVRSISSFDRNSDATTVFTSHDGLAHLNLITCEGTWNQVNGNYPLRLVVFTDAIPSEGGVVVDTKAPVGGKPKIAPIATTMPLNSSAGGSTISQSPTPVELGTAPSRVRKLPVTGQILIASAKSLYGTPTDGLVTSLLIISIVFIAFKIFKIRRR